MTTTTSATKATVGAALPRPRYTEGYFRNRRGQQLFYCAFFPDTLSVQGVVLFLHGLGEHSHRFTHVYEYLVGLGFGVIAYDIVSHGRSDCEQDGLRVHGTAFSHFVDDTNDFITAATYAVYPKMIPEQRTRPPLFFMGISFGTLVGLHTILSGSHPFEGIVLASPALFVELTPVLRIQLLVSKPLAHALPTARLVPGVNFDALTRNPAFLRDYMNDKLNMTENLTTWMGMQIMSGMKSLMAHPDVEDRNSAFSKIPFLILQGTADKVTSVAVARSFYERSATYDKEMKEFDGLFHCVFNEPEKDEVLTHAGAWLQARARQYATLHAPLSPPSLSTPHARL